MAWHLALNYIFSGAYIALQLNLDVFFASLAIWVNYARCFAIHLHQKSPFAMIDTGGSANRTINVNLHSMDDSFRSLAPLPSRATAGRHIPLCGGAVSFSAFLTCLSPRNSVRTCALARVEGSVPQTSGFGDRRSPLSYTRICALPA